MDKASSFIVGSGNVFADLGFANPEEMQLRVGLIYHINSELDRRNPTRV